VSRTGGFRKAFEVVVAGDTVADVLKRMAPGARDGARRAIARRREGVPSGT